MEAIRPSARPFPQLLLGIAVALLAGALIAVAVLAIWLTVSRPPSYRRYVSPPLPDGSRYTFLYPAHMEDVAEGGGNPSPGVVQNVTVHNREQSETTWDRLRRGVGLRVMSRGEHVDVLPVQLSLDPRGRFYGVKDGRARDRRWSDQWARGGLVGHSEYLEVKRLKMRFYLRHGAPANAEAQFRRHNATVAQSLQVLAPRAEVPSR